jgi:flagellar basal-body rod protein FlgB
MTEISQHYRTLAHAIEYAQQSHRVNGQNLANVNTPEYKAREVSFDQFIAKLEKSGSSQLGELDVKDISGLKDRADGNNVDLERELALLKKNAMAFQMLTQLLGSKMGIIQRSMS